MIGGAAFLSPESEWSGQGRSLATGENIVDQRTDRHNSNNN